MALNSSLTCVSQLTKLGSIETVAAAQGTEEGLEVSLGLVAPCEGIEDLLQANGKEGIDLEVLLMAEEMEFNQQLIGGAPIERGDHIGERLVKRPLAVGDGQMFTQVSAPNKER